MKIGKFHVPTRAATGAAADQTHWLARQRRAGPWRWDAVRFVLILAAVLVCALFGGSARGDVRWLLILRPFLIAIGAAIALLPGGTGSRDLRAVFFLLGLFALAIAVQLIPLPPSIWTGLPGHQVYTQIAKLGSFVQPWRPISITPWLTWNALLALLPASVVLFGLRGLDPRWEHRLVEAYLVLLGISTLIGLAQLAGAIDGPLFSYRFISEDSADGFFANRNHQAAFLATGFPVLRLWTLLGTVGADRSRRYFIAVAAAVFLIVVILVTGSRSGLVVSFVSISAAIAMAPLPLAKAAVSHARRRFTLLVTVATPLLIAALIIIFGKALAFNRFVDDDLFAEKRVTFLPIIIHITRSFFPFGSGFGSFDAVFRSFEPEWALAAKYFNHAHNDLFELILTGGVPALVVLLAFSVWIVRRAVRATGLKLRETALFTRTGLIAVGVWLLASLTDYPTRTPLAGAALAIALYWTSPRRERLAEPDQARA